jgi:hypothetical protein
MRIDGLKKYRGRDPKGYFEDLPCELRQRALGWLHHLCEPWGTDLPSWRMAILIGQARRLARTSPEERSEWGRRMLAKLGGLRTQQGYREQGRTGSKHPAHKAARVSAIRRRICKEEQAQETVGQPPKPRVKLLEIG